MTKLEKYLHKHKDSIHFGDIADILKDLDIDIDQEHFTNLVKIIPIEILCDVMLALPDRYFDCIIDMFSIDELVVAIHELESDDQLDFLKHIEDEQKSNLIFKALGKNEQEEIQELQSYKEEQTGSRMQLEIFKAHKSEIVSDAVKRFSTLRADDELENVQNLFITNKEGKLKYSIGLDDLLTFDFDKSLIENIDSSKKNFTPRFANDKDNIQDTIKCFEKYELNSMAVVDKQDMLLGRITSDDILDIINEQATEQMYNLAGVDDDAEENAEILQAGKTRAVWLGINLFTAIGASLVIGIFADTLNSIIALAILMPIVASMGGNAGTQSLTVVVRQLALGGISHHNAFMIIKKEVIIALLNGSLFAIVMGAIAYMWFDMQLLGVVIGLSMLINLLMAGFFGATIPLLLKRLKIDPAIGSTVILTTITDIVGFFSFLYLATLILI